MTTDTKPRASLRAALTPVSALLFSVALLLMGNGLQGTLIPVRGNIEHFGHFELGLLGTGYFAGFTLGCIFGPMLLMKGGHIRTFMAMASVASVIVLLHAIYLEPLVWTLLRGATGFCFAVLYVVIESWLNEKSTNENRGAVFSVYTVINLTVITMGQMMISLDDPALFGLFALASILVSVATLPVAFTSSAAPAIPGFVVPNLKELYRLSPVGFAGCLAVGLANGAFWTLAPVFAQNEGLDLAAVGLFMSAVVIGGAISQWPLGRLSDRMDRRYVIIGSSALAAVAGVALTFLAAKGGVWIFAIGACFGAGALPIYSLVVAHANDHTNPADMVKISSGLLLTFGAGAALGPLAASAVRGLTTMPTLFLYTTAVNIVFIAFVCWRIRRRKPAGEKDRVKFNESIINAQTVSPIATESATQPAPAQPSAPAPTRKGDE
ncbi:MAG: MFS transporter [Alphaproteobacteria bacterium]